MRHFDSLIMRIADETRVPAGSALAVDREQFSKRIHDFICSHPLIEVVAQEVDEVLDGPCIIASGPLTSDKLSDAIRQFRGED